MIGDIKNKESENKGIIPRMIDDLYLSKRE